MSCVFSLLLLGASLTADANELSAELIFPLHPKHNHAPGVVELPNGDLFVTWYRGSGERTADDVAVYASRRKKGETKWQEAFVLADTPDLPDCNTALFLDQDQKLWLIYPTILANTWESCLTNVKITTDFEATGVPKWERETVIFLKPKDFSAEGLAGLQTYVAKARTKLTPKQREEIAEVRKRLPDKLFQRLGWQPRCKPTQLPSGRILLPLYTDTFSISIMAITDDQGRTWQASEPLMGFGNIQPIVLRRDDGTLVAYMRENGSTDKIRISESRDDGVKWSKVSETDFPNPGAGIDGVRLANGHWVLVYNDTVQDRAKLAVSLSTDEGLTWTAKKHLEDQKTGSYHYPAITQGADGKIHCVYSYFVKEGKSMKHAEFSEEWITSKK